MLAFSSTPESFSRRREVHIFEVPLSAPESIQSSLRKLLHDDEIVRADRFVNPEDGRRFTAGRGALRVILARYLDESVESISFSYGERGKPALERTDSKTSFNVSHSGDYALIAVSNVETIGVDIEYMRESVEILKLARRYFCEEEIAELESLEPALQRNAFFDCWTRKESYMKAVGDGFSIPLKSFRVSLLPDDTPALLRVNDHPDEAARWEIRAVEVEPGYRASVMGPRPIDSIAFIPTDWQ